MLGFYDILSDEQIKMIHDTSLEIMDTIGFQCEHDGALRELADKGVRVEFDTRRVFFNEDEVNAALMDAPSSFILAARDSGNKRTVSSGGPPVCRALGGAMEFFNVFSAESRPLNPRDCVKFAILVDALPELDIITTPTVQEFPSQTYDVHTAAVMLRNTTKHVSLLCTSSRNLKYQLQIAETIAGSREKLKAEPLVDGIVCMIDPYYYPADEIDRLRVFHEYGAPIHLVNVPITGATAPYTTAGTLVECNAEFLTAATLTHFLAPDLPRFYYLLPRAMDMRTAGFQAASSPENQILIAAIGQLARHYRIPSTISPGSGTCCQPHQLMHQYGSAINLSMFAGASEVIGLGQFNGSMQCSPEMMVIANEAVDFAKRIMRGFELNRDAIGIDAMKRVGIKGGFMGDRHTLAYLRKEEKFSSKVFEWSEYNQWVKGGQKTILERAHERVEQILSQHEAAPLDSSVDKEISRLLASADKDLQ